MVKEVLVVAAWVGSWLLELEVSVLPRSLLGLLVQVLVSDGVGEKQVEVVVLERGSRRSRA